MMKTALFGVELEFYCDCEETVIQISNTLPDWWYLEKEKLQNQYEIVSPILEFESGIKEILSVMSLLQKNSKLIYFDDDCGIHIHIDIRNRTGSQIISYIESYCYLEKDPGLSLRNNEYCCEISDRFFAKKDSLFLSPMSQSAVFELLQFNKGDAINLKSMEKFGSLEFRALGFSLNAELLLNFIKILLSITNDE